MQSLSTTGEGRAVLAVGQVVGGRFEVEAEVEDAPLGRLYRARDQKTGRAVALRLASPAIFGRPETAGLLREECRAIAKLQHRSLALTFGVGQAAGAQFVATDWVEGEPLADYVRGRASRGAALRLVGAYNIVAHVAKALERLHEATCHGAITPSAIRVTDVGRVQLTGAGIALAAVKAAGVDALGAEGRGFAAPEVVEGGAPTKASDVYSLGAVLFYLLTGRDPSAGFMPPSMLNSEATPPLDDVLLRCLDRDPSKRFATPTEFRLALQPVATGAVASLDSPEMSLDIAVGDRVSRPPDLGASAPPAAEVERISVAPIDAEVLSDEEIEVVPESVRPKVEPAAAMPTERASLSPFAPMQAAPPKAPARGSIRPGAAAPTNTASTPRAAADGAGGGDLKDLVAKITENDALRWMVVKDGLDHGPFTGRDLIQRIVKGEVAESQIVANMETGQRGPLVAFELFGPFIEQQKLHHKEAEKMLAVTHSEKTEKRRNRLVFVFGAVLFAAAAAGTVWYVSSRNAAEKADAGGVDGDIVKGGDLEVDETGKPVRGRRGRRGRGGAVGGSAGGGGGAGLSYEEAMNQAVNLGDVSSGGAMTQLSPDTIKGTMDRQLGSFQSCVQQEHARGGSVGRVTITMAILGSGAVQGVSVKGGSPAFTQCIAGKVRAVRFPSFAAPRMGANYGFDVGG